MRCFQSDRRSRVFSGDAELSDRVVDDPLVRLVRDVDVDVVDRLAALREDAPADETMTRVANLKTSRPFIFTYESGSSKCPRAAARIPEVIAAAAVRSELEAKEAAVVNRLHDDGARPVAEQDERRAILPVEDLRSTSPPTTSARLERPDASMPYACATAYTKPVQPASRS